MVVCPSLLVWQQQLPWLTLLWELCLGSSREWDTSGGTNSGKREGLGWVCRASLGDKAAEQAWGGGNHFHLVDCIFPGPSPFSLDHCGSVHSFISPLSPEQSCCKPSPSFYIALSSLTLQLQRSHLSRRCLYHDLHCYWVLNIIFFSSLPYTSFPHANCSE